MYRKTNENRLKKIINIKICYTTAFKSKNNVENLNYTHTGMSETKFRRKNHAGKKIISESLKR